MSIRIGNSVPIMDVRNKTIIGLKFNIEIAVFSTIFVRNKTIIGLKSKIIYLNLISKFG